MQFTCTVLRWNQQHGCIKPQLLQLYHNGEVRESVNPSTLCRALASHWTSSRKEKNEIASVFQQLVLKGRLLFPCILALNSISILYRYILSASRETILARHHWQTKIINIIMSGAFYGWTSAVRRHLQRGKPRLIVSSVVTRSIPHPSSLPAFSWKKCQNCILSPGGLIETVAS